jgi:hypothetical protein
MELQQAVVVVVVVRDDDDNAAISSTCNQNSPAPKPSANVAASMEPLAHTDAKAERDMASHALGSAPARRWERALREAVSERCSAKCS